MRIHNYTKYASIHIYVFIASVVFNLLFFSTYIEIPEVVTRDALRLSMGSIFIGMLFFSAIFAFKSVIRTKQINRIKPDSLNHILHDIQSSNHAVQHGNELLNEEYSELLSIQEERNQQNQLIGIKITPIDYQPFWFNVIPFSLNIVIESNKIKSWRWIADKEFFDRT